MDYNKINSNIEKATNKKVSYISGYTGRYSKVKCRCNIHNIGFEASYDTIIAHRYYKDGYVCPQCKKDNLEKRKKPLNTYVCDYCGKEFKRRDCNHKFKFCCRKCKDEAQKIDSGERFANLRPDHYGEKESIYSYRSRALDKYENKCAVCGYDEDIDVLEVHHIDSNRSNNKLDNLIVLCPTCHKKLTTGKYKLVDRNKIIKK